MSKVKLRQKAISGGRNTIFLDIYPPIPNPDTGKLQRKHYLKVFVYSKPKTELERFHNRETLELVETERALRQIDVQNMRFGFLSQRMMKGDFVEFFENEKLKKKNASNSHNWRMAITYFKAFAGEKVLFPQLNETFSEEFADYLLSGPALGRAKKPISTNTAVSYFAKFKATVKQAFKKGFLPINLGEIIDSITPKDTHREFCFSTSYKRLPALHANQKLLSVQAYFPHLLV